jgi:hypothetical protein
MKFLKPNTVLNLKNNYNITADILEDESRQNEPTMVFICDSKTPACSVDLGFAVEGEIILLHEVVEQAQAMLDKLIEIEKRLHDHEIEELSFTINAGEDYSYRLFYSSSFDTHILDFNFISEFETSLTKLLS